MAKEDEVKPSGEGGTPPQTEKETINRNPIPDSEKGLHPADEYDFDFEYLASPQPGSEKEKESVPADKPVKPVSEESKIAVPPIASKEEKPKEGDTVDKPPVPAKGSETRQYTDEDYRKLQSFSDTRVAELTKEISALKTQVETDQNVKVALEEFKKEPLAFLQRHVPQLAEKLDTRRYILDKLKAEFGSDFAYDPAEAYVEGTTSYKIRAREDEIKAQVEREKLNSEVQRETARREQEAFLSTSKKQVMEKYGLDEQGFEKEIVGFAKSRPPMNYMDIARIKYLDWEIQQAVKQALEQARKDGNGSVPPSINKLGGGNEEKPVPKPYEELQKEFGDY